MTQRPTKYNHRKSSLDPLNPSEQRCVDRRPDDTGIFQYRTDPATIKGLKTRRIAKFSGHTTNISKTFVGLINDNVQMLFEREARRLEDTVEIARNR